VANGTATAFIGVLNSPLAKNREGGNLSERAKRDSAERQVTIIKNHGGVSVENRGRTTKDFR